MNEWIILTVDTFIWQEEHRVTFNLTRYNSLSMETNNVQELSHRLPYQMTLWDTFLVLENETDYSGIAWNRAFSVCLFKHAWIFEILKEGMGTNQTVVIFVPRIFWKSAFVSFIFDCNMQHVCLQKLMQNSIIWFSYQATKLEENIYSKATKNRYHI